jgi:hypothetical protein
VLHRGRGDRVPVELHVVVGVDVDEARRHDQAVRVDDAPCFAFDTADRADPPVAHRDVRGEAGQAGAVDDLAAADHEVVGHLDSSRMPRAKLHITRNVFAGSIAKP